MSEDQTPATTENAENTEPKLPPFAIKVEDAGPAAKKVSVEVPQEVIADRVKTKFKDLRTEAQIPGFRKGHAPARLLEKKFSSDVRNEVRSDLIRETYQEAIEKNELKVLGEPEFDKPDDIKLPEDGAMTYSFQVEVQPTFDLPSLDGVPVKKPVVNITDEHLNQAMNNLREQQGAIVPVEGRGVQEKDVLTVDIHVKLDGADISHQHDQQLHARPARIFGIQIEDLPKQLEGAKPGETRTINVKAPADHPNESARGKDLAIEIGIKDIKHLELAEINQDFLDQLGFTGEQELRDALKDQMVERIHADTQRVMRQQVSDYLLKSVNMELPVKLSAKQADRVVNRRAVDLLMRGIPEPQIVANIEKLKTGAGEEAARELKSFFILNKVADTLEVDVSEAELNGRIAQIAVQQGQRPERLKQQMYKDNTLQNLYMSMREEKAIDKVLEKAKIEEVQVSKADEVAPKSEDSTQAAAETQPAQGESSAT